MLPEVQQTLQTAFVKQYGNSTASHYAGAQALTAIEDARELFAKTIAAFTSEIIFTSGATESNNIAFKSILLHNSEFKNKRHIVTTEIEHKCILTICHYLQENHNFRVTYVKPCKDGLIRKEAIQNAIQPDTGLVSVMHVNNELGTVNPITDIGNLCFEKGILFHSDAAQSFCKVAIDVDEMNIDVMSFSAHKIGGPKGIGAIYIRDLRKRELHPVIHGAGQEEGLRGGTIATPLISGFAQAIKKFPSYYATLESSNLKQLLLKRLTEHEIEHYVNGNQLKSLSGIVSISFPRVDLGLMLRENENSMALAQGSACSSKQLEPSHVLSSIGIERGIGEKTLRLSFNHLNNESEVNYLITQLKQHSRA